MSATEMGQLEAWKQSLKKELKLEDVSSKTTKKQIEGGSWPTLSLDAKTTSSLPTQVSWKKASQTYVLFGEVFEKELAEDLRDGVRCFFFEGSKLDRKSWDVIKKSLEGFPHRSDLEVFVLGKCAFETASSSFRIHSLVSIPEVHNQGGDNIQELAWLARKFIQSSSSELSLGVYVDSQFFKNIAKIRAAKLLAYKLLEVAGEKRSFSITALSSHCEWTLYERYSNMLRNETAVASAYIAGADYVQSSGYQVLHELETGAMDSEHRERSLRMARNTSHILSLESMLGVVEDAAHGSYHLENLTQHYAASAWDLLKKILPMSDEVCREFFKAEVARTQEARLTQVMTRKLVMAGMNDFPDGKERLGAMTLSLDEFRVSRPFEELRLKIEGLKKRPVVTIAVFGDLGALNARINFVKNYFELLGLDVKETQGLSSQTEIVVICALDDDYGTLSLPEISGMKFIAGKVEREGFENLYAGQNVFEILSSVVANWSQK